MEKIKTETLLSRWNECVKEAKKASENETDFLLDCFYSYAMKIADLLEERNIIVNRNSFAENLPAGGYYRLF